MKNGEKWTHNEGEQLDEREDCLTFDEVSFS